MTSKEKCECGHDLHDGERCRTAISVLPMKQCTCIWSRPAAWQNAAESLPAEPEQETDEDDAWKSMVESILPIAQRKQALVDTNEKEPDWAKLDYAAKEHGCPCDKCAEPKPTPSAPAMNMVEIVRPTAQECFDKAIELIHKLRPAGCFGDEEGNYSSLEFYVYALKPQPDSSSISTDTAIVFNEGVDAAIAFVLSGRFLSEDAPTAKFAREVADNLPRIKRIVAQSSISTEQTFEEWWDKSVQPDYFRDLRTMAKQAWNAAKGQSNGR